MRVAQHKEISAKAKTNELEEEIIDKADVAQPTISNNDNETSLINRIFTDEIKALFVNKKEKKGT